MSVEKSLVMTVVSKSFPKAVSALWRKINAEWRCTRAQRPLLWMVGNTKERCADRFISEGIAPHWTEATDQEIQRFFPSLIGPKNKPPKKNKAVRGADFDIYSRHSGKGAFK